MSNFNLIRYHKRWIKYLEYSLKYHRQELSKARNNSRLYQ